MSFEFICVSGYGKTGSGVCIDLLKEFEGIGVIEKEFRLSKDPYGLVDLESSLVDNWEFIRHDVAIRDFLNYCKMLSRGSNIFSKTGKNFDEILSVDFMSITENYIERISKFKYNGDSFVSRYYISAIENFIKHIRSKLKLNNSIPMFFSAPDTELFDLETKQYVRKIFESYVKINNLTKVVLDQSVSPSNITKTMKYFQNSKLIIIDRDPRDVFVNMVKRKKLLGSDVTSDNLLEKYLMWHKQLRKTSIADMNNTDLHERVLKMKFEDFVLNYDNSVELMKNFLNIKSDHKYKFKEFKPENSIKNIGLWRSYRDQNAMSIIYNEMGDSCFDGASR